MKKDIVIRHKLKDGRKCKTLLSIELDLKDAGKIYRDGTLYVENKEEFIAVRERWLLGLLPRHIYYGLGKEFSSLHDLVKEIVYGVDGVDKD